MHLKPAGNTEQPHRKAGAQLTAAPIREYQGAATEDARTQEEAGPASPQMHRSELKK